MLTLVIAGASRKLAARSALGALLAVLTLAVLALVPPPAWAHAVIVAARPAAGSTVDPGVVDVRLEFNSRIDVRRSALSLLRPDGTRLALTPLRDSPPGVLAGRGEVTAPGAWTLEWQALSVDGHITRGVVQFSVRGPP
ncbi:MAG TPA: copper resistance protein CopC [Casimicrobiaceae bacterium]|nr:copper resistance protein CopC [Casimicrobiaceae bacterium]